MTSSKTPCSSNFLKLILAPTAYYRKDSQGETLVATHVDDCTSVSFSSCGSHVKAGDRFADVLTSKYQIATKDFSKPTKLLGWDLHVDEQAGTIKISAETKIRKLLETFGLTDANMAPTPMIPNGLQVLADSLLNDEMITDDDLLRLLGALQFLGSTCRPDILFPTQSVSRCSKKPTKQIVTAAKRILRYLKGTASLGLVYRKNETGSIKAYGFCDSDFASDPRDRKSIYGHVFMHAGAAITWRVKKQDTVANSTAEAEYIAVSNAAKEAKWVRSFFKEIGRDYGSEPVRIFCDNQAAVSMTKNAMYHSRTKHIDIAVHHIRDLVSKNEIIVEHVAGVENPADIFTKPLPTELHKKMC